MILFSKLRSVLTHQLVWSSAFVFAGSTVANFSGWLYHVFIGRILGPDGYAELSALLALFFILNVFSGVIQTTLVRFFSVLKARKLYGQAVQLFWHSTRLIVLAEIGGFFLILPFIPLVATFLHISNYWYFIWVYFIFATTTVSVVNGAALQGFQRFIPLSVYANVGMIIRLATGVVAAFFGIGWTLIANIVTNIVSYTLYFLPLSFLLNHQPTKLTMTRLHAVRFAIPVLLATLGVTVINSQDIILVKHYFSGFDAGIYSSLSVLGKVIFYASAAVGFVLFPVVAEKSELGQSTRRSIFVGLGVIGAMSLFITLAYFIIPDIAIVPFGRSFAGAAPYLGWFGIFVTIYTLATMLLNVMLAMGKSSIWVAPVACAIIQGILIVLFHQSIYNVIFVNTFSAGLLLVMLLIYYRYATSHQE